MNQKKNQWTGSYLYENNSTNLTIDFFFLVCVRSFKINIQRFTQTANQIIKLCPLKLELLRVLLRPHKFKQLKQKVLVAYFPTLPLLVRV